MNQSNHIRAPFAAAGGDGEILERCRRAAAQGELPTLEDFKALLRIVASGRSARMRPQLDSDVRARVIELVLVTTLENRGHLGLAKLARTGRLGSGVAKVVANELGISEKTVKRLLNKLVGRDLAKRVVAAQRNALPKLSSFRDRKFSDAIFAFRAAQAELARSQPGPPPAE